MDVAMVLMEHVDNQRLSAMVVAAVHALHLLSMEAEHSFVASGAWQWASRAAYALCALAFAVAFTEKCVSCMGRSRMEDVGATTFACTGVAMSAHIVWVYARNALLTQGKPNGYKP